MAWAPVVMDLDRLRTVQGLEDLRNMAYDEPSSTVDERLTRLSAVQAPAIEQIHERVYNAVGFDVANSTFVLGDEGIVVIDAMTSIDDLSRAMLAFREVSDLPVKGIVYTHSHGDHWAGSPALIDPAASLSGDVVVIAQRTFLEGVSRINGFNQPIMAARAAYQFGTYLEYGPEGPVNGGAGPFLSFSGRAGLVPPNTFVDDRLEITIAGIRMEIVWVPSEAPDEIAIWMPDLGVLNTAELVQGECYPNVYTLRGDVPRPAAQWRDSIDALRRYPAEALAKTHGRSVVGREAAAEHLRDYRDAIAWTHDQTVRLMNKGYVPDQIVDMTGSLPPHLEANTTTGWQGYGSVPQAVRSTYSWHLGFNTGEVTDFDPVPYERRQLAYVDALGGRDRVVDLARRAIDEDDRRWAIELLGWLVRSDPSDMEARRLSAAAHRDQAFRQQNATWRNWYLTAAAELEGTVPVAEALDTRSILEGLPLANLIGGLPVRLRAEATLDTEVTLGVSIGGLEPGDFTLIVRRGVLEVVSGIQAEADVRLTFDTKSTLVAYLVGTPLDALDGSGLVIEGDRSIASAFVSYLDDPPAQSAIMVTIHGPVTPS